MIIMERHLCSHYINEEDNVQNVSHSTYHLQPHTYICTLCQDPSCSSPKMLISSIKTWLVFVCDTSYWICTYFTYTYCEICIKPFTCSNGKSCVLKVIHNCPLLHSFVFVLLTCWIPGMDFNFWGWKIPTVINQPRIPRFELVCHLINRW